MTTKRRRRRRPLERNVVIREGSDAAVSLRGGDGGVPALQITGSADELANQVRLLSSDLSQLALSSKVVTGPINSTPSAPANPTTLRDLGQPGATATAFKPQVVIGVDQTRLGKPVRDVRVQLKGSYTPLPSTVGGQIVVSADGETIDRWTADSSGTIDRSVSIPQSELQRYTNLSVAVDIAGDAGQCGDFQPVTLKIDDSTTIDSSPADPPDPAGIPIGSSGADAQSAGRHRTGIVRRHRSRCSIMEGLQRISGPRIDTEVVPLASAVDSGSPGHPDLGRRLGQRQSGSAGA